MDAFKVEQFQRNNFGHTFPHFEHLSPNDCHLLQSSIIKALGLAPQTEPLTILRMITNNALPIPDTNAEKAGFNLSALLSQMEVQSDRHVYINWGRFDDVDLIALEDLSTHLDDIWYPGPDDIEVFDSSLAWFLLVSHNGVVSLYRRTDQKRADLTSSPSSYPRRC